MYYQLWDNSKKSDVIVIASRNRSYFFVSGTYIRWRVASYLLNMIDDQFEAPTMDEQWWSRLESLQDAMGIVGGDYELCISRHR